MTPDEEKEFRDTQKLAINLAKWLDGVIRGEPGALPTAIDSLRGCGVGKIRADYIKYMRDRANAAALTWEKKAETLYEFSNKAKALGVEPPGEVSSMIGEAFYYSSELQQLREDQLMEAVEFPIAGTDPRGFYTTKQPPPQ